MIETCGVVTSTVKSAEFSAKDIEQDLSRLLKSDSTTGILPFAENKVAMSAASALIRYLSVSLPQNVWGALI